MSGKTFCNKVTISDHTPYNLTHGNGDPAKELVYFNNEMIVRLIKVFCSLLAKNCHTKGSELIIVAVMTGELTAGHKNFLQFA